MDKEAPFLPVCPKWKSEGESRRPVCDAKGLALLQNLARQLFDAFSDRLVFDRGRRGTRPPMWSGMSCSLAVAGQ
jgi:hypothetical protein